MHLRKKGRKDLIQCGIGVTVEESTVMVLQQRKTWHQQRQVKIYAQGASWGPPNRKLPREYILGKEAKLK